MVSKKTIFISRIFNKRNPSSIVAGSLLICLFILSLGCSRIENKAYVKKQVMKMYEGNTTHPARDLANRFNNAISSSGSARRFIRTDVAGDFNRKCRQYITGDSILVKYFEGFIDRLGESGIDINSLNFHGLPVRQRLQKELGIKLLL
jgi:hypothetical protein